MHGYSKLGTILLSLFYLLCYAAVLKNLTPTLYYAQYNAHFILLCLFFYALMVRVFAIANHTYVELCSVTKVVNNY